MHSLLELMADVLENSTSHFSVFHHGVTDDDEDFDNGVDHFFKISSVLGVLLNQRTASDSWSGMTRLFTSIPSSQSRMTPATPLMYGKGAHSAAACVYLTTWIEGASQFEFAWFLTLKIRCRRPFSSEGFSGTIK